MAPVWTESAAIAATALLDSQEIGVRATSMSASLTPAVPPTAWTVSNCPMTTSVSASLGSQEGDVKTDLVCVSLILVKMEGPAQYPVTLH